MKKIGLALSGGGFRASLYHLGLVRFLHDAGILPQVTHITSVSGGSVTAAHLVLNWNRYNGSANDFDAVASELLSFVRLDVRNRITRRFPLTFLLRGPRHLMGRSNRKLTRTGLLEYHYEKYLYGDTSLFELPEQPQVHILATNLSEGCLCSFNRNGLLMVRRRPDNTYRLHRIHVGLATVPMAVTASSAFPGFLPPVELTGADVGASVGEFGRQAYTDGGVFDNLGVRMFRCLERTLLAESPLSRDDFVDFEATIEALLAASRSAAETPLRRLAQVMVAFGRRPDLPLLTKAVTPNGGNLPPAIGPWQLDSLPELLPAPEGMIGENEELVLSSLSHVLHHYEFRLDPLFVALKPLDPNAEALLHVTRLGGRVPDAGDQLWLNRHLLEAAFRQATGHACFRRLNSGLDGVLVSDVGKRIEVQGNRRAGGLIRTALRASDILMDRVWQLETETFRDTPGFVFAPIRAMVEPAEDATALHPEIQRQLANIRTDLDRFSPLEISSLVRHGYCVGRKTCRANPELFGADLPAGGPWDPVPAPDRGRSHALVAMHGDGSSRELAAATIEARTLQASALRRIWSTMLDYRDWVSYIYVPLIVPILILMPYLVGKYLQRSHHLKQLVESLSQGSSDLEKMSDLLEHESVPWTGEVAEKVPKLAEPDLKGFEILQDSRIIDLRSWRPHQSGKSDPTSLVYIHHRMKVVKQRENVGNNVFRLRLLPTSPQTAVRFPSQLLEPKLRRCDVESSAPGQEEYHWEASFDFQRVPAGQFVDLIVEEHSPGDFMEGGQNGALLSFPVRAETAELTVWVLMPKGKEYRNFGISRHQAGKPETAETVRLVTEYLAEDYTILAFKLLALKPGFEYEVYWLYK
jgi:predicted acylesterase/phospholipase RssA